MARKQIRAERSLLEVLAEIGWSRRGAPEQHKSVFDADGNDLGALTAHETWQLLHARGLRTLPVELVDTFTIDYLAERGLCQAVAS